MDCQSVFENHVRVRLETSFGKAVAMLILASASNACNASLMSIDGQAYEQLCNAIASDQRVIDMWGTVGAEEALTQWRSLVSA